MSQIHYTTDYPLPVLVKLASRRAFPPTNKSFACVSLHLSSFRHSVVPFLNAAIASHSTERASCSQSLQHATCSIQSAPCNLHHDICIMPFAARHLHHAIRIMPSASCHPHYAICIMPSASCHLHHVICIMSSASCHATHKAVSAAAESKGVRRGRRLAAHRKQTDEAVQPDVEE